MYIDDCRRLLAELPPRDILERRDGIEYPRFEALTYYSSTAGRDTRVNVLLPKDFTEGKKYPVLYLLHGYWCDENWMAAESVHLSVMLNNLVSDGEAEEMIVVCPYIYCSREQKKCTAMDYRNSLAYDNFINDLTTDLMPFIESRLPVAKCRENTAISGFSMGGREALYIGVSCSDRFGYVGAVCPAPGVIRGTEDPYNLEPEDFRFKGEEPYLLLMSASVSDNVVSSAPFIYHELLAKNGTEHIWHELKETGHDESSVIPHLYNLFRMLFKK